MHARRIARKDAFTAMFTRTRTPTHTYTSNCFTRVSATLTATNITSSECPAHPFLVYKNRNNRVATTQFVTYTLAHSSRKKRDRGRAAGVLPVPKSPPLLCFERGPTNPVSGQISRPEVNRACAFRGRVALTPSIESHHRQTGRLANIVSAGSAPWQIVRAPTRACNIGSPSRSARMKARGATYRVNCPPCADETGRVCESVRPPGFTNCWRLCKSTGGTLPVLRSIWRDRGG